MRRAGALLIIGGLVAWLLIGGAVLFSLIEPGPALPTIAATIQPTRVAIQPSATATPTTSATPEPTITPFVQPPTALPETTTPTTMAVVTNTPALIASGTPVSTSTAAPTRSASGCAPPDGWTTYTVGPGDTLFGFVLGSKNTLTVEQIMQANCLKSKLLSLGQVLYLPPGAAANAPKVDDGPAEGPSLPAGATRKAACPCTLSIRAGWRREQIAAAIDTVPVGFTGRDFLAVTGPGITVSGFAFLEGKPATASFEGFLFPGSYALENTSSATDLRDMLLRAFGAAVPEGLRAEAASRGLSFYAVVALASVVQRESYAPSEQVQIASVFYNRMAAGKALSSTATVQYAVGRAGAWWPKVVAADLKNRSRYNTYIWLGVPPTPISNPNLDALLSTLRPAQTNFQYFAGDCNGGGNFYTATYAEFEEKLKACGVLK